MRNHFCIGLTGGIGSGKSTVAELFKSHGATIIDTDEISRQLTQAHGLAIPSILQNFGSAFITKEGSLNRVSMRQLIFTDASAKQKLEQLLHPLIFAQAKHLLEIAPNTQYVLLVVPLLFDSPDFLQLANRVLVVDCDENTQIQRVMQRSQLNEMEVRSIILQQTPRIFRLKKADDILVNNTDLMSLAGQVTFFHQRYITIKLQNCD